MLPEKIKSQSLKLVILSGISRQSVKRAIQTLEQAEITVTRTTTNGRHGSERL
ncbi:hypothetical protein ACLB1E_37395 [Escherichia coli]